MLMKGRKAERMELEVLHHHLLHHLQQMVVEDSSAK
jgi:hypothetical protein